jgi:hypothetical protein
MITPSPSPSTFRLSRCRRIFCSLLVLAAFVALVGTIAVSRQPAMAADAGARKALQVGKIAPWVMEHTANGQQAEFFVVLTDQADLSQAASLQTKVEKAQFVYTTLANKAQTTQGPVLQWLRDRGLDHRSFYIVNAILVKGTRAIAEALAARPDVAVWKVIRRSAIGFLDQTLSRRLLQVRSDRRLSSLASLTRMHRTSGRSGSLDRILLSRARIPAFAGRTTH